MNIDSQEVNVPRGFFQRLFGAWKVFNGLAVPVDRWKIERINQMNGRNTPDIKESLTSSGEKKSWDNYELNSAVTAFHKAEENQKRQTERIQAEERAEIEL